MKKIIGLFGTCYGIQWRDDFIKKYQELNISFFNPTVSNWNESYAKIEAQHLATDEIILFPILEQSYGIGSLAEVAFGPLKDLLSQQNRKFIYLIHPNVTQELIDKDPNMAKVSKRTRTLVNAHLAQIKNDNILIVSSLDEMLELSISLYDVQ